MHHVVQNSLKARESATTKPSRWGIFQRLKSSFSKEASSRSSEKDAPDDEAAPEVISLQSSKDIMTAVLAPGLQYTFPEASFDCCVDTFGLCSCSDPVQALVEMSRVCISFS